MKEEIDNFKRQNGDMVAYTVKELVGALHIKQDKTNEKIEAVAEAIANHQKETAENYVSNKSFRWTMSLLTTVILLIMGYIIGGG